MKTAISPPHSPTRLIAGHRLEPGMGPVLLTLALGVFVCALDLNVLSPALPVLSAQFGVSAQDASLALTVYLLANIASIPVSAKLADRYGRQPIYLACIAIFMVGSVITIVAPQFWVFLLGRIIQALGAGGVFPVATATIADRIPLERRGGALGILGAIWGVAGILGPIVGGLCTTFLSWHWIFLFNLPLGTLVLLLAKRYLPALAPKTRGPLDLAGLGLLTIALLAVVVALSRLDPAAVAFGSSTTTIIAAVVALAAFAALHVVEERATSPVLSPQLLRNPVLGITYILELGIGALEGSLFFVPPRLPPVNV